MFSPIIYSLLIDKKTRLTLIIEHLFSTFINTQYINELTMFVLMKNVGNNLFFPSISHLFLYRPCVMVLP